MKFHVYKNKEQLCEQLALWMSEIINFTLQNQEFFTLALSGGETPKLLFKNLSSPEFNKKINWKRVHIFWGDERVVPFNDKRNNAGVAYELLINHVSIPAAQIHKIRADIEPIFAAKEYEKILHTYFDNTNKSFDLALLGIGADGHTLSLFPGSPIIEEHDNWVNAVFNEEQKMYRVTLMPVIVNRSAQIAFMVSGSDKAIILKKIIEDEFMPSILPAQIIKPPNGELHFFLDEAAAKEIDIP